MKTPKLVTDAAEQATDKAQELYETAADKAHDLADQTTDKAHDLYAQAVDKAKDLAGEVADKARDLAGQAGDKAHELYDQAADKVKGFAGEAGDKVKSLAGDAADRLPAPVKKVGAKTAELYRGLTPTQKLVGGLLLAAGVAYLAAPKKKAKAKRRAKVLSALLLIVNDRVEGYKKAAAETRDAQQRGFYQDLVSQSQHFASTLNGYLTRHGQTPETGTTLKGKLYRRLMEAQAAVTGHDEKALLAANVFGEKQALRAYKKALRSGKLKGEVRETVKRQRAQSKKTLEHLKMLAA